MIWTKAFWKGAAERALKTFSQTFVSTVLVTATGDLVGIADVNWGLVLGVTGLATLLSFVTSIGSAETVAAKASAVDPVPTEIVVIEADAK